MFDSPLLPLLVVALVVVGVVSVVLVRRRANVWRQFARRNRLQFHKASGSQGQRVEGVLHGRRVELAVSQNSSDTGVLGAEDLVMMVELQGRVPDGLTVLPDDLGGPGDRLSQGETIDTGDAAFDEVALVRCARAEEARAYLTPGRRTALLELLNTEAQSQVGLQNGRVFVAWHEMVTQLDDLQQRLAELQSVAQRLDEG